MLLKSSIVFIATTLFCGPAAANPKLPSVLFPSDAQNRCAHETGILNLTGYHLTFSSDFKTVDSISSHGSDTTWIAHTPNGTDFGDAPFGDPVPGGPYSAATDTGLRMRATKNSVGKWQAALISSINTRDPNKQSSKSFTQEYGYFEACMKLPDGPGVWPAFWLLGADQTGFEPEIDVIEYYGGYPTIYHTTAHVWPPRVGDAPLFLKQTVKRVASGILQNQYNSYGVDIESTQTTFYFNRISYFTMATPQFFKVPMYVLADLALGGGFSITGLTTPQDMYIDYIRVWQKNGVTDK